MKKSLNTSVYIAQKWAKKNCCGHYSVADTLKWLLRDNRLLKTNNIWYSKFIQYAIITERLLLFIRHLWNSGMSPRCGHYRFFTNSVAWNEKHIWICLTYNKCKTFFLMAVHKVGFNLKALNWICMLFLYHVALFEEKYIKKCKKYNKRVCLHKQLLFDNELSKLDEIKNTSLLNKLCKR